MSREKKAPHDKQDTREKKSLRERYRPPIIREIFEEDETPPRKRTGRPPELTRARIKNIAYNILSGSSIDIATQQTGVPRPTYYMWRDKGRRGRSSTNPKEQEELALYVELLDTCEEALAARREPSELKPSASDTPRR